MVTSAEMTTVMRNACIAALSAPYLSFAPIRREIAEAAPAPRPFPRPMRIRTGG